MVVEWFAIENACRYTVWIAFRASVSAVSTSEAEPKVRKLRMEQNFEDIGTGILRLDRARTGESNAIFYTFMRLQVVSQIATGGCGLGNATIVVTIYGRIKARKIRPYRAQSGGSNCSLCV